MPIGPTPQEAFGIGNALGQTRYAGLGAFVDQLTNRMNELSKIGATQQAELGKEKALIPLKEESELRLAEKKGQAGLTFLDRIRSGQGGNIPVGSTASMPGPGGSTLNIQLNPNITADESTALGTLGPVIDDATKLKNIVLQGRAGLAPGLLSKAKPLGIAMGGGIIKALNLGGTENVGRDAQEINNLVARLKRFAFVMGGKQLTPAEREVILDLLEVVGRPTDLVAANMDQFIRIARDMSTTITEGTQGARENVRQILLRAKIQPDDEGYTQMSTQDQAGGQVISGNGRSFRDNGIVQ